VSLCQQPGPMHTTPGLGSPGLMAVTNAGGALTSSQGWGLTGRLGVASQVAESVALDGRAHQSH
jgi:hypothetical protein